MGAKREKSAEKCNYFFEYRKICYAYIAESGVSILVCRASSTIGATSRFRLISNLSKSPEPCLSWRAKGGCDPLTSNFLVRAWRARLPWDFWLFAFTTFTEARFFHDFYAEKELEGSLFLMPIRPLFFWIKRWIVKMCPKYTRYLLFLSEL